MRKMDQSDGVGIPERACVCVLLHVWRVGEEILSVTSNLLSLKSCMLPLIEIVSEEPELGSYWDVEGTRVGQSVN